MKFWALKVALIFAVILVNYTFKDNRDWYWLIFGLALGIAMELYHLIAVKQDDAKAEKEYQKWCDEMNNRMGDYDGPHSF